MAAKNRPCASVITLDGTWAAPSASASFELPSNADDPATQLLELSRGLRSYLSGAQADRVVIRRADRGPIASNTDGPRHRLFAEGALAAGAREEVELVLLATGKDLAHRSPAANKADLDRHAGSSLPGEPVQAAAAALVGLSI